MLFHLTEFVSFIFLKKHINKTVLVTSKSGINFIPLKQVTLYIIMHMLNFKSYILIISVLAFYLIFSFFFFFCCILHMTFSFIFTASDLRKSFRFQNLPAFDGYFSNLGTELSRPAVKQVIIVFDRNA